MFTLDKPTCWKCGSPVFNHWLRGYVCPYCTQVKQLKAMEKVASQQARQLQIQQADSDRYVAPVYQAPVYELAAQTDTQPVENKTGFVEGTIATIAGIAVVYVMLAVAWWAVVSVCQEVIYPVLHFVTFGLI